MPDHDVVIVGAGPVGLLLACLLAARDVDVVVCERRVGPDPRTRAIGVHPPGLASLDAAGVGQRIREQAVRLERGEVHARGRLLAAVPFDDGRGVLLLPQARTDAALRARLRALGGVVREGCEVLAVRQDGARAVARLRSGSTQEEIRASFLVAADGVRSSVRVALGIGWARRGASARYSMIDIPDADRSPVARLFCGPEGLVESFPLPEGRRRWVVRHPERVAALSSAEFAEQIRARTGIAVPIPQKERPTTFLAAQHRATRLRDGRILLLGDAAHEISPIGGQGMNLGWVDARRLGDLLIRALAEGTSALDAYERRGARAAADAQRRSGFYMAMGAPAAGMAVPAREAMIRLLGTRLLRRAAAGLVTMRGF